MKLYIIGNGFDLAHGLKTTYKDYKTFIKERISSNYKWECVLNFYPDDYDFWSDIEYYVCNFNLDLYFSLKRIYSFGLLDELYRQVRSSFEKFILIAESKMLLTKPVFSLDKNAFFITFNYTTTLEQLYKIPHDRIIYLHNDIAGPALDILYNIPNHQPCVIGHSSIPANYFHYSDIRLKTDNEYLDFVKNTTKDCENIIKKRKLDEFLSNNKDKIDEVIFYGFSFSITDKPYIDLIFKELKNPQIVYKVYYKVQNQETPKVCVLRFKEKLKKLGIDCQKIIFINSDGVEGL